MRNAFADTMQTQGLSAICGIGLGADSEEKHEPASDIDTAVADSLKVLDLKRPIREADMAALRLRAIRGHGEIQLATGG